MISSDVLTYFHDNTNSDLKTNNKTQFVFFAKKVFCCICLKILIAGSRIARLPFRYERNVQTFTLTRKSYKECQRTISKVAEVGVEPTIELTYVMSVVSVPRLVPANSKNYSDDYYCFQCPSENIDTINSC